MFSNAFEIAKIENLIITHNKMKAIRIIPVLLAALAVVGCSSNKRMAYDDTYYSPYNTASNHRADRSNGGSVTPSISSSNTYDYQAYYWRFPTLPTRSTRAR